MPGFIVRTLICAFGLWAASEIVTDLEFDSTGTLLLAAFLLGVVNAVVRPLFVILTFPITVLTLGLFLLVVNAGMLALVAALLDGFHVVDFWAALWGSIIVSLTSWVASWTIGPRGKYEVVVVDRIER